jgi:hypothetical protein
MTAAVLHDDPIDRVLDDVTRRVRGPARLRRDLLAELRDGLEDAAAAHEEAGLDVGPARARAVADFGSAAEVGAACQEELTAVQARRTSLTVCLVAPAVQQLWMQWYPALALSLDPRALERQNDTLVGLHVVQSVLVWVIAGAALHQFMLLGRGRGLAASRVVAGLAIGVLLLVAVMSGTMAAAQNWMTLHVLAASPRGWALAAVSAVMWMVLGSLTWRTVVVTRHAGRAAALG